MRFWLAMLMVAGLTVASFAKTAIQIGGGGCFYGDAIGFTLNAGFEQNLSGWMKMFGMSADNAVFDRLMIAGGLNLDATPVEITVVTIAPELVFGYEVKLSDFTGYAIPFSATPYLGIGFPINIFGVQQSMAVSGGVLTRVGLKAGYAITPQLEAGLGFDYKMNITGVFMGYIGLYGFVNIVLQ